MFIGGLPSGTGDLMVPAEAPSTRLTDKQTSVYWWLTVGERGLDGGGRRPQHQTGHAAMTVLTSRAVGATPQTAVLGRVLRTRNFDFLGLDRLWGFPAGNLRYPLRDQFIDVILDDLFSL